MTGAEFNNFDIYTLYIREKKILYSKPNVWQLNVDCGWNGFALTPTTGNNVIRNVPIDLQ